MATGRRLAVARDDLSRTRLTDVAVHGAGPQALDAAWHEVQRGLSDPRTGHVPVVG